MDSITEDCGCHGNVRGQYNRELWVLLVTLMATVGTRTQECLLHLTQTVINKMEKRKKMIAWKI